LSTSRTSRVAETVAPSLAARVPLVLAGIGGVEARPEGFGRTDARNATGFRFVASGRSI
jgi:hypothetical protein